LQANNKAFIHSLFTVDEGGSWDNMWAICGRAVVILSPSRIVIVPLFQYAPETQ